MRCGSGLGRAGITAALLLLLVVGGSSAGCSSGGGGRNDVSVLYAGSLVRVMEEEVGPAFGDTSEYRFRGEGRGSVAAGNLIRDGLRNPDVFISADSTVNEELLGGSAPVASWYLTFASTDLVLAYDPGGPHAEEFASAAAGRVPWYQPLLIDGLRLGRSDPDLDPAGYRAIFAMRLAEQELGLEGIAEAVLGRDRNPAQIFAEEDLAARLEAGQLDAVFVYRSVAKPRGLVFVELPPEAGQGDPALADLYASQTYRNSTSGRVYRGRPVVYTVTVGADPSPGALPFVRFLLGGHGADLLAVSGLVPIDPEPFGDRDAVPAEIIGVSGS